MYRRRQTARKSTGGRPPTPYSPTPLPKPDVRWMVQQNVPDNDTIKGGRTFVLRLDDHNSIHVYAKQRQIDMARVLDIVLKKYDAHIDEWPVSRGFICSMPQCIPNSIYAMKSVLLKAETEELYALFAEKVAAAFNFSNNVTTTYAVETTRHSVLLHVSDIIVVTECKSESSGLLLQIPHDIGLPAQSKMPVSTIHVPSRHMILQFREDPSLIRKYCFFTKQWSQIEGIPNKDENVRHLFQFKSATLTSDENQVVIFAEEYRSNKKSRRRILVLDMTHSNFVFLASDIPCHGLKPKCIMRTGGGLHDEKLVIGWIRILFESSTFNSLPLPPLYLMQGIAKWYSTEMIHVLDEYHRNHYAVRLDVIRPTLTPLKEELKPRITDQVKDAMEVE